MAKKKLPQLGLFDVPAPESAPAQTENESVQEKPAKTIPLEPERVIDAEKILIEAASVVEKAASVKTKKETPPPVTDAGHDETPFIESLITRAIGISATARALHAQPWFGKAGDNLRAAYFRSLEEYRGVISLLWVRRPSEILDVLERCNKEVEEVERKIELLYPVYVAQNYPEATGQVIEELGMRQARLHDQLDVLAPFGKLAAQGGKT